jgi:glycosyltransferase involved in cell wall biosynthesis
LTSSGNRTFDITRVHHPHGQVGMESENNMKTQDVMETTGGGTPASLSVVIPVFNESGLLPELYRRLVLVLEGLGKVFEIIFVDDGSSDTSWLLITELHARDGRVKGLRFSRNFGHHVAISAGIDHARGDAVVVMDGDLQDRPEEIPRLLSRMAEGYDLVYGVRMNRKDTFLKKAVSVLFGKTIRLLSGMDIPENQAMLRVMSRKYVDDFRKFKEKNRYLGGLFTWLGHNQSPLEVEHGERYGGKSKYTIYKMLKLTFHAITSFSYFPLQLAGLAGMGIALVSFMFGLWFIVKKVAFGIDVAGWPSTMVTILFLGGIQLAVLGLIGEYLGRVFTETQNRPLYIIRQYLD